MIHIRNIFHLGFVLTVLNVLLVNCQKSHFDGTADFELSIIIAPGGAECFWQKAKLGDTLELEYQVIDANFGEVEFQQNLDINFHLYSPSGRDLISDFKQSEATHRHAVKEGGDFKLCFDNSYSLFSKKTVYFEVFVESDTDDDYEQWEEFNFSPELQYNDTMDQIKNSIAKVREDLTKIKHHQDQLRAIETRDRNLQEHNFTRVNQFSTFIIILMVAVGGVQ